MSPGFTISRSSALWSEIVLYSLDPASVPSLDKILLKCLALSKWVHSFLHVSCASALISWVLHNFWDRCLNGRHCRLGLAAALASSLAFSFPEILSCPGTQIMLKLCWRVMLSIWSRIAVKMLCLDCCFGFLIDAHATWLSIYMQHMGWRSFILVQHEMAVFIAHNSTA